jgi:hypothetical protein
MLHGICVGPPPYNAFCIFILNSYLFHSWHPTKMKIPCNTGYLRWICCYFSQTNNSVGYLRCLQNLPLLFTNKYHATRVRCLLNLMLPLFTQLFVCLWKSCSEFLGDTNQPLHGIWSFCLSSTTIRIWNKMCKNVHQGGPPLRGHRPSPCSIRGHIDCEAAGRAHAAYEVTWNARPQAEPMQAY